MRTILAVDGYNVIHAWPDLRDWMQRAGLQAARDRLCARVQDYAAEMGIHAIVVFDAHHTARGESTQENYPNMDIVYTTGGETADHYIERLALQLKDTDCQLQVATSDGMEQFMVLGRGAVRVLPRELLEDIKARREHRERPGRERGTSLGERISPAALEALERMRRGE